MRKYIVCENTVEIKSSKPLNIRNHDDFMERVLVEYERATDRTPLKEYGFDTEEEARAKFEELKKSIGYLFNHYALYTLTVDEVYIEVYEVDEDGDSEYYGELEHEFGEPEYEQAM